MNDRPPISQMPQSQGALDLNRHIGAFLEQAKASAGSAAALPSVAQLSEIMQKLRAVFFPECFLEHTPSDAISSKLHQVVSEVCEELRQQIVLALSFHRSEETRGTIASRAQAAIEEFAAQLLTIKALLASDVDAALDGDPAVHLREEVIFCYPSITALLHHRVAHALYRLSVPLVPRIISELAHSSTGIDIHPGASIGERCFLDHGTGIVIGETTIIGCNARIYQGVTLGARKFSVDQDGRLIKGQPRHPIVGDNVVIYAAATVLGRVKIGNDVIIGGNVWVTRHVADGSRIVQSQYQERMIDGAGDGI